MKLEHLTTFLTAADELNFTHAARRLHLSQSAVSQQIRELEVDLGVSLFERRGRGLLLTPAGERLRATSKPLMRDVRRVRDSMDEFKEHAQGVLRVGATQTPGVYLLPYALGEFARRHPGVRISLRVTDGPSLTRAMQDGDVDVALREDDPAAGRVPGWEAKTLLDDELVLIAGPEHPLAKGRVVALEDLVDKAFIFRHPDSPIRQLILNRVGAGGVDPDRLGVLFELDDTEGIKRAVMAGLGAGWVSRYASAQERQAGWLKEVPVEGLRINRALWLFQPNVERQLETQRQFVELLESLDWLPADLADVRPS